MIDPEGKVPRDRDVLIWAEQSNSSVHILFVVIKNKLL